MGSAQYENNENYAEIKKKYAENFVFLNPRNLELFTREVCIFL